MAHKRHSYSFDSSLERFAVVSADNRVNVWDTASGELRVQCYEPTKHLSADYTCIAWGYEIKAAKGGKKSKQYAQELVALGTGKGTIVVWDVRTGEVASTLGTKGEGHTGKVNDVVFDDKGAMLYSCGDDGNVCQWDMRSASLVTQWKDTNSTQKLAINPAGTVLATSGTAIKLWDMSSHKSLHKFTGHSTAVTKLVFTPDGKYLLSSAAERLISMWDCNTASPYKNALKIFAAESVPVSLEVCLRTIKGGLYYHFLALTETGILNVWAVKGGEIKAKLGVSDQQKFIKPSGVVHAADKADNKTNKGQNVLCAQFADHELFVTLSPEAGPSFQRVTYLNEENNEVLADMTLALSKQQEEGSRAAKKAKTVSSSSVVTAVDLPPANIRTDSIKSVKSQHAEKLGEIEAKSRALADKGKLSVDSFHTALQQAIHTGDKQMLSQCLQGNSKAIGVTFSKLEPKYVVPLMRILIGMLRSSANNPSLFAHLATLVQKNTALLLASGALPECTSLHSMLDARLSYFKELAKLQGRLGLLLDHIRQNDQVSVDTTPKNVFKEKELSTKEEKAEEDSADEGAGGEEVDEEGDVDGDDGDDDSVSLGDDGDDDDDDDEADSGEQEDKTASEDDEVTSKSVGKKTSGTPNGKGKQNGVEDEKLSKKGKNKNK